ncbi:dTDP-glucose 4,6-dehydratase [Mariniradius saccharolyticus AK6]|uniref:dTDP-glucose 4,6-dehydratase n=1 Tax=Mariniradius saccharolyticus AK6 TaxID=1239962 RepID=M7XF53_9BACT|nr:NAD-dependent epimerase [Mariniradius saccharolyticus]EMS33494.1 dTDP-glucose 4,6-dehydratase [Mariniradius saccharolyticus AK6]
MKFLVTGTAGFIGFHVAQYLLNRGDAVVGVDNINDYYDVNLKYRRLEHCGIEKSKIQENQAVKSTKYPAYTFYKLDLANKKALTEVFEKEGIDVVINLAAQAGVRYSLTNPDAYITANIQAFLNILEACRAFKIKHLVYASSSSVYGANTKMPFATTHNIDHPVSLYAATKKSNELMAHTYSHLFGIPTTGLRFFTVYGPWGRPDMALFLFIEAMLADKPIDVFNHGKMKRDFTYIDDIVEGIVRVADRPAKPNPEWSGDNPDPGSSYAPFKVYNIGNSKPVELMDYIGALEKAIGKTAEKNMLPLQMGDVPATYADVSDLIRDTGYKPNTPVEEGVAKFVSWYRDFYGK